MTVIDTPPKVEPPRDRWGRYLIPDPETGKPTGYTRATTFAKSVSDTFGLTKWMLRMGGIGLAQRQDLLLAIAATDPADSKTLDKIMEDAKDHAGAMAGATIGTALHTFTEQYDLGLNPVVPAPWDADVAAYAEAISAAGIEILNKSQHIATLSDKGRLVVDLTVERGKGYVSSDRDTRKVIGIVPIDAIFSPVRRCTYLVEPTRVEQSTNYDRIVLDIETDGSIEPREALASAGATLRSLVDLVATMSDAPVALELGEIAGTGMGSPDLDLSIEDLDLSERPRNCLKRAQVNTVGELLLRSEEDLLNITNFGQKSLDEIKLKLDERGLSLRI